jgi:protein-tyrosine phosphatase
MIDLHTHILPGIDDGVPTEDDAVEFARVSAADGVATVVATPHCREGFYVNERDTVLPAVEKLRKRLLREGVPLEVLPGAEVHIGPDLVARVRDGRAPTLADNGKTLLLELSTTQPPMELERLIFDLKLAGILVVLAHPERIRYFQDDVRRYESAVRLGAYGQITTGSVLGVFGEDVLEFSEELLRKRLVQAVASDAHNVRGRPPVMSKAVRRIAELVGDEHASRMASDVPRALLDGREPDLPPLPEEPPAGRSLLSRWFRRGPSIW